MEVEGDAVDPSCSYFLLFSDTATPEQKKYKSQFLLDLPYVGPLIIGKLYKQLVLVIQIWSIKVIRMRLQ